MVPYMYLIKEQIMSIINVMAANSMTGIEVVMGVCECAHDMRRVNTPVSKNALNQIEGALYENTDYRTFRHQISHNHVGDELD